MSYERRKEAVASGNCGHCYKPRGLWKYLCDECAGKHRERQRVAKEKKQAASGMAMAVALANNEDR